MMLALNLDITCFGAAYAPMCTAAMGWTFCKKMGPVIRETHKEWLVDNPDYCKVKSKEWCVDNPDYCKVKNKEWCVDHPDYDKDYSEEPTPTCHHSHGHC